MSHRLNSFYTEGMQPFIEAMANFLVESGRRGNRPALLALLARSADQRYAQDQQVMLELANESAWAPVSGQC